MKKENETQMNIYQKLLEIQKEVKGLSKDKKSHNYEYVTGNKLLSFIKPLMDKYGLILKQEITSIENSRQDYNVWDKWAKNENGQQGDWKPKNEILSKVMMKFTWIDVDTGEKDENTFGANGQNDWEKGLGSALTYGERYFLLKYFHIATDEDDIDNPERKKQSNTNQQPTSATPAAPTQELPWLNLFDNKGNALQAYTDLEAFINSGKKTSLSTLKQKFKISKETEKQLKEKLNIL